MTASQGESWSVRYKQLIPKVDTAYTGGKEAEIPQYYQQYWYFQCFFPELYQSQIVPNYGQYYAMDLQSWCFVFYNVCLSILNTH